HKDQAVIKAVGLDLIHRPVIVMQMQMDVLLRFDAVKVSVNPLWQKAVMQIILRFEHWVLTRCPIR
ncbi:MAG: hypothetical protein ACF8OB_04430, partial [Phycisphaeraceae bacterium JB051]